MQTQNLTAVSSQWASRPDDQRFLTLDELEEAVAAREEQSWTVATPASKLRAVPTEEGQLMVEAGDEHGYVGGPTMMAPSHWSFGQLAMYASAPSAYLRTLPPELAAINLQWGWEHNPVREDALVLGQNNGVSTLRAVTSLQYGRIWDKQVVKAVQDINQDGRWQVPAASYSNANPRRATTLYASDRDVFIFLVDPENAIEVDGETMFRGFYVWNSEVGAATFGLAMFLYRYVCDNRIIWGATNIKELRIRHTGGAPDRFAYEGQRYLRSYANESTEAIVAQVKAAKEKAIPKNEDVSVADWLRTRGFTKAQAEASVQSAQAEEGRIRSIWDIVNGVTAHARSIAHTDARVELESKAGKLMAYARPE